MYIMAYQRGLTCHKIQTTKKIQQDLKPQPPPKKSNISSFKYLANVIKNSLFENSLHFIN